MTTAPVAAFSLVASHALVVALQSSTGDPVTTQAVVRNVLQSLSPQTAALYGGSGIVSIAAIRTLVKHRAGSGAVAGTSVSTSGGTTVSSTSRSGGGKHGVAFVLPRFLPLPDSVRHVTHTDIHAFELGFVAGVVVLWMLSTGNTEIGTGTGVAFLGGSVSLKHYSGKLFKTVRHEPWYALVGLVVGAALGWGLFVMDPNLLEVLGLATASG